MSCALSQPAIKFKHRFHVRLYRNQRTGGATIYPVHLALYHRISVFPRTHPSLLVNLSLVLSTQKSITASCPQLSLFVISPTHIISDSPHPFIIRVKSDLMFLLCHSFFLYFLLHFFSWLNLPLPVPLFLSLFLPMQILHILRYFKLSFFCPLLPHPLSLASWFSSLVLHALYHFWQQQLKKGENLCKCGAWKMSVHLGCNVQRKVAPHYNIFSLLWIRGIIIKNDLWCRNETESLLLPWKFT